MSSINSDVAYDYIRRKILSGEYPPGQPLMTLALAEEIGVSRTPVRDALRQLEADGLVLIRARLGASVRTADLGEFRELCGLRLALESFAAGLAATHRTEEDLAAIRQALEAMDTLTTQLGAPGAVEEGLHAALVREDIRFHVAIISAAKNRLMKKEILRLHLINRVVAGPSPAGVEDDAAGRAARRAAVLESHRGIYEAIAQRDVARAKAAMENHIQDIVTHHLRRLADRASSARALTEEEMVYST